jgi:hypothetical protein
VEKMYKKRRDDENTELNYLKKPEAVTNSKRTRVNLIKKVITGDNIGNTPQKIGLVSAHNWLDSDQNCRHLKTKRITGRREN